jgi:hypothetical protein
MELQCQHQPSLHHHPNSSKVSVAHKLFPSFYEYTMYLALPIIRIHEYISYLINVKRNIKLGLCDSKKEFRYILVVVYWSESFSMLTFLQVLIAKVSSSNQNSTKPCPLRQIRICMLGLFCSSYGSERLR